MVAPGYGYLLDRETNAGRWTSPGEVSRSTVAVQTLPFTLASFISHGEVVKRLLRPVLLRERGGVLASCSAVPPVVEATLENSFLIGFLDMRPVENGHYPYLRPVYMSRLGEAKIISVLKRSERAGGKGHLSREQG